MDEDLERHIAHLPPEEIALLKWHLKRRTKQIAPDPLPFIWFILGGRGSGKALDLNTPIPTPSGWIKMGDTEVGDEVFDEKGRICKIQATYDIIPERAYELTFSDKSTIISGGEHLWVTSNVRQRRIGNKLGLPIKSSVISTDEIVNILIYNNGPKNGGVSNHSIALQGPLQLPESILPIDPWLLGFWLGDGSKNCGMVTISDEDIHLLSGFALGKPNRKPGASCVTVTVRGLHTKLRELGLLYSYKKRDWSGFKHIPEKYLWSSENQRLALLRGLMDSDGYADRNKNTVEFCSIDEGLADSVLQLSRSLGEKPVKAKGQAKLNGIDCGPKFRITWCPTVHNPFSLERKASRLSPPKSQISRRYHRMIKSAVSVPVRPMRCLTVDSPSHMFLAGEQMIPTHNTLTAASHVFEYCMNLPDIPENREVRVALVGQTYDDVKKTMVEGLTGLLGVIPLEYGPPDRFPGGTGKWNRTIGELTINLPKSDRFEQGRKLIFASFTAQVPGKLRGPQFHLAWIDEPAKFVDADIDPDARDTTWNNLNMGMRNGPRPHVIVSGTPTPSKLVLFLLNHPNAVTTVQTTWENRANLPENYVKELERLDPNSRTYRQEVLAHILLDTPDALFSIDVINETRGVQDPDKPFYKVLGYDPAASSSVDSDEAGIILVGYNPEVKRRPKGGGRPIVESPTEAYVLKDLSGHLAPSEQSELVIRTVLEEKCGDLIFEQNMGVDMIVTLLSHALKDQTQEYTIRRHRKPKMTDFGSVKRFTVKAILKDGTAHTFLISAIQAMKAKKVRAESASYHYDVKRVHHPKELPVCKIESCKQSLEGQMTTWSPNNTSGRAQSPDRMDALVYALFHIFGRHALHSNSNSRLITPTTKMTDEQKNPAKLSKKRVTSIYAIDMGSKGTRTGFERRIEGDSIWTERMF